MESVKKKIYECISLQRKIQNQKFYNIQEGIEKNIQKYNIVIKEVGEIEGVYFPKYENLPTPKFPLKKIKIDVDLIREVEDLSVLTEQIINTMSIKLKTISKEESYTLLQILKTARIKRRTLKNTLNNNLVNVYRVKTTQCREFIKDNGIEIKNTEFGVRKPKKAQAVYKTDLLHIIEYVDSFSLDLSYKIMKELVESSNIATTEKIQRLL